MHRFFLKLRKRPHLERDLDEELQFHREHSDRRFGNLTRIREDARELWTFPFIENLLRDFRLAVRVLLKNPSFSVVSLLTLSLGIGINTAVFTLYDSLTYRLLPVRAPEELARVVRQSGRALQPAGVSYEEFGTLRQALNPLASVIATSGTETIMGTLTPDPGTREGMKVQFVARDYFDVLGINGRLDKGAVLSYTFWKRRLNADPNAIGKVVVLGDARLTISSVAPDGFYGTDLPPHMPDMWLPLEARTQVVPGSKPPLHLIARRKAGTTVEQLSKALQFVRGAKGAGLTTTEATVFQTNLGGFRGTGSIALILMGAVGVILLIGCVNLVNLTLSRNAARKREIAVRLAIGAGRRQIMQQLCAESIVLGLAAGVFGLVLSALLCDWIRVHALAALGQISEEVFGGFQLNLAPDWRVFAYTLSLSVVTGALVGVWPALGSTRTDLTSGLKSDGLRTSERRVLLTAQIAACFVLLAGAGLLFRGTWRSRSANPGFRVDNILLMSVDLTSIDAGEDHRSNVLRRVLEQMRDVPDVASGALVDRPPFLGTGSSEFSSDGQKTFRCRFNRVSGEYFHTLEVPLLEGRSFTPAETEHDAAEVVVSAGAAQFYWPGQNPLGRQLRTNSSFGAGFSHSTYTVIGVAKVVRNTFLSKGDNEYLYFPKPISDAGGWLLLRTRHSPEAAIGEVRDALMKSHPALAAHAYLISLEAGPVRVQRLMTDVPGMVSLGLGLLALLLAAVGVYGVVMYMVAQRIRVIGIHMALGAQRLDVIRLVLGEGLHCVAQGTVIGLLGAASLSCLLAAVLKAPDLPDLTYQAGVFDPLTFAAALGALTLSVLAACSLPVYRATRVDPVSALRND